MPLSNLPSDVSAEEAALEVCPLTGLQALCSAGVAAKGVGVAPDCDDGVAEAGASRECSMAHGEAGEAVSGEASMQSMPSAHEALQISSWAKSREPLCGQRRRLSDQRFMGLTIQRRSHDSPLNLTQPNPIT